MSKTDLRARPVFHHRKDAIDAHLTVVVAALAVSRYLYQKTGITTRKLVQTLKPIQEQTILRHGETFPSEDDIPPEAQKILDKLGH